MINDKIILSVVLARGGSQGIPMKNVKELCEKPLFMWSVDASLQSDYVDYTVVSSNCNKCKEIFNDFIDDQEFSRKEDEPDIRDKIAWIDRPEEFATATSKNEEAMIHAIEFLKKKGMEHDSIVTLQPTSPCRYNKLLDKCIKEYYDGEYDSLVTGKIDTPFIWRKERGEWVYDVDKYDCCDRKMRQEYLPDDLVGHDDGSIFISDIEMLLRTKCRIGKKTYFYETDKLQSLQIDEEIDFQLIENIVNLKSMKSLI